MACRLNDLTTCCGNSCVAVNSSGGRKDQRFWGKVAERQLTRRLTRFDVNEKYFTFGLNGGDLGPLPDDPSNVYHSAQSVYHTTRVNCHFDPTNCPVSK